jgi:hypothetical protein
MTRRVVGVFVHVFIANPEEHFKIVGIFIPYNIYYFFLGFVSSI